MTEQATLFVWINLLCAMAWMTVPRERTKVIAVSRFSYCFGKWIIRMLLPGENVCFCLADSNLFKELVLKTNGSFLVSLERKHRAQ